MGCDIHMWLEVKEADNKWRLVMSEDACYSIRSYSTFAVLGDVRNYLGVKPVAKPRGLPADVSPEVIKSCGDGFGHSPSWLLLSEVLSYDWGQPFHRDDCVFSRLEDLCGCFLDWARGLREGPTNLKYVDPERIRLVFFFDN